MIVTEAIIKEIQWNTTKNMSKYITYIKWINKKVWEQTVYSCQVINFFNRFNIA